MKSEIVRLSVDLHDYRPQNKFTVLIVGSFVERKGHEVLFRAIRKLNRDDVEVWVVGDRGVESTSVDVKRLAQDIGVEGQVAFYGKLSGVALKSLYRACDVFCLPCRTDTAGVSEGFPSVLIEALAFGKPVITTKHVEIPRIIPEILAEENDVDSLAEALDRVCRSVELRTRLSEQNRRLAELHFSKRNAQRTSEILAEAAGSAEPDDRKPFSPVPDHSHETSDQAEVITT